MQVFRIEGEILCCCRKHDFKAFVLSKIFIKFNCIFLSNVEYSSSKI
jgi:hypothetical protein